MNKRKYDIYQEYCIGCGLCKSERNVQLNKNVKGFLVPDYDVDDQSMREFLENVCPVGGKGLDRLKADAMWGDYQSVYAAYATDGEIRKHASSGGVLTALAIFLLEENKVDGIIHVGRSGGKPYETKCFCSTTRDEVIANCGSRYAISAPLISLSELIKKGKRYCVIGKPCDITVLRNYLSYDKKYKESILYLLSFFCAGLPSDSANKLLLERLGCPENECVSLNYRGDGWPGCALAVDTKGKKYSMGYSDSWGGILGRDVNPYCRFCMDGIGEAADIACGDGWYMGDNNQPDFSEREGRNVVFTRNARGEELFQEAVDKGYIVAESWENIEQLKYIQKYQYTRRSTMKAKVAAYKLMGRKTPLYRSNILRQYARCAEKGEKMRIFLGTIKRIVRGKV